MKKKVYIKNYIILSYMVLSLLILNKFPDVSQYKNL